MPGLSVGVDGPVDVGVDIDEPGEFALPEVADSEDIVSEFINCAEPVGIDDVEE